MTFTLAESQAQDLMSKVDAGIQEHGCDHSLRLTFEWAAIQGIDRDDLLDLLEAHGCFCDCEVVCNLPQDMDVTRSQERQQTDDSNPWQLPPDYKIPDSDKRFDKQLVSDSAEFRNCYAPQGDILTPPPFGTKARKRVKKSIHFFVGLQSGWPNELGCVRDCAPMTAAQFAKIVRESGHPEFSSFRAEEAHFVLSRLERLPEGTPVATHFSEVYGISSKRRELRVHKVIIRKR